MTDLSNPISATKCGQEALQDILTGIRDFILPFYGFVDLKKRNVLSTHQALLTAQQCDDTLQQLRLRRERLKQAFLTVKNACDRLPETDPAKIIPYKDLKNSFEEQKHEPNDESCETELSRAERLSLLEAREQAIARYLEVSDRLNKIRKTFTEVLWTLNDLMDPIVVKQ